MAADKPEPPKILNMNWCDGCDRIDWRIAFNHFNRGKRCPGLVHDLIYDRRK